MKHFVVKTILPTYRRCPSVHASDAEPTALPPNDGKYILTNLPKCNDLRPGQQTVEEALAQTGKL